MDDTDTVTQSSIQKKMTLKEMLLDAIEGVGVPSLTIALEAERHQLVRLAGTVDNAHWRWVRDRLAVIAEPELQSLYYNLKVVQHGGQ